MPTYDYQCDACDHQFELYQGINEPKKKKCPECGKLKLRRLIGTGAAIVFKGSGFYQTDYRSENYKKSAAADKPSGEGSSTDSAKSSDAKKSSDATTTAATATNSSGAESKSKTKKK